MKKQTPEEFCNIIGIDPSDLIKAFKMAREEGFADGKRRAAKEIFDELEKSGIRVWPPISSQDKRKMLKHLKIKSEQK